MASNPGKKVSCFIDVRSGGHIQEFLTSLGLEGYIEDPLERFAVASAEETYCPTGEFIVEDMLGRLREFYTQSMKVGHTGARVSGEMTWALDRIPGSSRLVRYEALLNDVLVKYPVTVICQYNVNFFDGATLFDILSVHPMMIVHEQIVNNPYYIKAEEFLRRYDARKRKEI
ncbi:MAG: MEDS domain-containing protein [Thermodesulfobacteriota bacterium]